MTKEQINNDLIILFIFIIPIIIRIYNKYFSPLGKAKRNLMKQVNKEQNELKKEFIKQWGDKK